MENITKILDIVCFVTPVSSFLLKTSRVPQAIELCQEFLILLNSLTEIEVELVLERVYCLMMVVYRLLNDHISEIECGRKRLGLRKQECEVTSRLANLFKRQGKYQEAKRLYKKSLSIAIETGDRKKEGSCYNEVGIVYHCIGEYGEAEGCQREALVITKEIGHKEGEAACYCNLGTVYQSHGEYRKAEEYQRKALAITREIGDKEGEAACYRNLGSVYKFHGEYGKAEEYQRKALAITTEIGDKEGEAACYGNLGTVYESLGEYGKAEEYQRRALAIIREIGDKEGEAACYGKLGTVYQSLGKYAKAEEHQRRALAIRKEIGNKRGEALCYGNLGTVYESLGKYGKGEEYHRKALAITREIGDKVGEAACYGKLGTVYQSLGKYAKAEEHQRRALAIRKEIGNKRGEALCYCNLGTVYQSLGEYGKAEEYQRKALAIGKEIGNKQGEAACYSHLGMVYQSLGEFGKAEEYQRKALARARENGDKQGESACYGNLGTVYESLGEHGIAEEYQSKALAIENEIGDKNGVAQCYGNLGIVYQSLGEYGKAEEYQRKALAITREIGHKQGEGACYGNLGTVYESLGEYGKAEEYQRKALAIRKEIADKQGEATCYGNLGNVFSSLGKHPEAKEHYEKALAMSREIGDIHSEAICHLGLAYNDILKGNLSLEHQEIVLNLRAGIDKCEKIRNFLGSNDQFKISFSDKHSSNYDLLGSMFCASGNGKEALCVLELGRARALADLISGLHSTQQQTSPNPPSWADIERIVKKESNCSFLYISYFGQDMFLWVLKGNKPILFRRVNVNECFVTKGLERSVDDVFSEESFRRFIILPHEHCEDRSLSPLKASDSTRESAEGGPSAAYRPVEEEEEVFLQPLPTRTERYRMIIAPVAEFLDQPELIIVPDRYLYKVPFAALQNESGNYLSEDYRIRIVPSLMTLGLIQCSPVDYHSRTGALIVGEPDVRDVSYKGSLGALCRLPSARAEAEMIGKLIGAEPLLGKEATKQTVLHRIQSVCLIHFAAHGDAERGEIALAPQQPFNGTPTEEDYLLTMAEISQVQLHAKLVVLSCCHSAQGQVRAEGVVGIARAFLGSGARSVLAALWPIPDKATKELMSRFYEHLVRGESASESLHQAKRWMRNHGYSYVRDWASFMLIGDNVTFDFGK